MVKVAHVVRRWRHALCLLRGGHTYYHPIPHVDALIAYCSRCGHVAVLDLSDLARPVPYHGVPTRRRVS